MATFEQRLQALEAKHPKSNIDGLLILIDKDVTELQKKQIEEAERIGQHVIRVEFIAAIKAN